MNFIDYFTPKALAMYWEDQYSNSISNLGETMFGTDRSMSGDLRWIKGSSGLPISLMPSTYDAKAKFRTYEGFEFKESTMPFFREGYLIKEKDRRNLMRATSVNDPYNQEIITRLFDSASFLINGARVVPERMIWQLLAPEQGNCGISIVANGCNYTYNYDDTGEWKQKNYLELTSAADKWNAHTTSKPLEDMRSIKQKALKRNGNNLITAYMSYKTFTDLQQSESLKNVILSQNLTPNIYVTDSTVLNVVATNLGINIIVYAKQFKETETSTAKPFYPDGYVTFVPQGLLGNMVYTPTPEEVDLIASGIADVSVVNPGISISRIINPHPVNVEMLVSESMLPSFERMDDVYLLKVS